MGVSESARRGGCRRPSNQSTLSKCRRPRTNLLHEAPVALGHGVPPGVPVTRKHGTGPGGRAAAFRGPEGSVVLRGGVFRAATWRVGPGSRSS